MAQSQEEIDAILAGETPAEVTPEVIIPEEPTPEVTTPEEIKGPEALAPVEVVQEEVLQPTETVVPDLVFANALEPEVVVEKPIRFTAVETVVGFDVVEIATEKVIRTYLEEDVLDPKGCAEMYSKKLSNK